MVRLTEFPTSLFHIAQSTDSYGSDLFLNDRVGDIFADNEVLRVIKGASIRDSLPPDYVNGRAGSVQPSYPLQRKRSPATSNLGDDLRAGKRQKVYRPDDPLPSRERDSSDSEEENLSPEEKPNDEIIPNSQGNEVDIGHIKQEKPLPAIRPSAHQPSLVLGEGDDDQVVSDSQGKETSGRNITPQARQSQNVTKPQETIQPAAKTTSKPSNGVARRPSNKRRERSDDISDFEEHTSATPSVTPSRRGISDPYSDIETDLEQPSSILRLRGRVTPLRKSKKASPISARPKLLQYGKAGARSKAGSSSNNSTPKAITAPAPVSTPRSARMSNGDAILPEQTRQNDSASADNGSDKSERGGVDAGAENAAREFTTPISESARQKRIAELEKENSASISKAKIKADAAARRKATAAQKLKVKQDAAKEKGRAAEKAEAAKAKAKLEGENVLAEEARRQAEVTENAEAKKREEATRQEAEEAKRQEAKEAVKREAEEAKKQKAEEARKRKAEDTKKQKAEAAAKAEALKREDAAKRECEASDRKEAEVASTHKRSTPARSPGGILGKAVADFNAEAPSTSPGANVVDMPPPPAAARGHQSTSPTLTRKRSEDIRTTPILPPHVSSDTKPAAYLEPGSAARRVSFAEPSPPVAGKTPSRTTKSPAPIQTPKTVNGIQSSSGSFRQSKLVPPGTGAKSVTPKVSTPSSSQASTSGQRVKLTPTPHTRADITAALLNTINKGSCKLQSCYSITPNQWFLGTDHKYSNITHTNYLQHQQSRMQRPQSQRPSPYPLTRKAAVTKVWANWSCPRCLRLHPIRLYRVSSQQAVIKPMTRLPVPHVPRPFQQTGRSVRAALLYDL